MAKLIEDFLRRLRENPSDNPELDPEYNTKLDPEYNPDLIYVSYVFNSKYLKENF